MEPREKRAYPFSRSAPVLGRSRLAPLNAIRFAGVWAFSDVAAPEDGCTPLNARQRMNRWGNRRTKFPGVLGLALLITAGALSGCVSKSKAEAQARAAFLAGQQQAAQQMQARGPNVTVIGEVKNTLVPWTADLTLVKAILAADYYGAGDPKQIIIVRGGEQIQVDPNQLLKGEDILLQPRDVIEIRR